MSGSLVVLSQHLSYSNHTNPTLCPLSQSWIFNILNYCQQRGLNICIYFFFLKLIPLLPCQFNVITSILHVYTSGEESGQPDSRFLFSLAHEILESIHKHLCTSSTSWTGSCCLRGISRRWVACSRLSRGRRTRQGSRCRLPGPLASGKELRLDFHRHRPYNPFPLPRQALLLLRVLHLQVFLIGKIGWWLWRWWSLIRNMIKMMWQKKSLPYFSGFVPSSLTSTRKCLFLGAELELCTNRWT